MFLNILLQVGVLLILIALGFVLAKVKMINEVGAKCLTDLVLYAATPCVIVTSFIREFEKSAATGLLISISAAVAAHILFIVLSLSLIRAKDIKRERVLRFAAIFANCGFMALPLQQALLGSEGVFYGSSVVAVFNIFVWSFGVYLMSGDKKYVKPKALAVSPSIIAIAVGIIIFLFSLPVPDILRKPMDFMAGLNTPLPMIVIGYHLAHSDILKGLRDKGAIFATVLRLIIFPAAALLIMYLCGIRGSMLVSLTIAFSSPIAAMTAMFSARFDNDTSLAATIVSMSHIISIITMPPIIYLAQVLA
ncbi:MAG: AEC family transporter [Clostridia bacterium]|nr:AEC family transporter [Clostridia bacterium]